MQGHDRKQTLVDALQDAGLDEAGRHRFHAALERRNPAFHEELLAFLGVSAEDRRAVATWSRDAGGPAR